VDLATLFSSKNILVVGDSILDEYIYGKVYRVSPEAPVPVVLKNKSEFFLGGAANVAQNISAFGSKCSLVSLVGNDEKREILNSLCKKNKIDANFILDPERPTTVKTRIIGNNHQITRIDQESNQDLSDDLSQIILKFIEEKISKFDAVILQDYGKGMLTAKIIQSIVNICKKAGVFIIADPKEPIFSKYSGCNLIKPNLSEFKSMCGLKAESSFTIYELVKIGQKKLKEFGFSHLLITMSEDGMLLINRNRFYIQSGNKIEVSDVSGAGDTVSAVIALSLTSNISFEDSLKISNEAGSLVCQVHGAVSVNPTKLFKVIQKSSPVLSLFNGEPLLV